MRPNRHSCWPAILSRMTRGEYIVINESVEGRTTGFDIGKLNSCRYLKKRLKKIGRLDYIFIFLGTNDVKNRYGPPRPSAIRKNIDKLTDDIRAYQKSTTIVFLLPPPIGTDLNDDFSGAGKRVEQVRTEIQRLCLERNLTLIDTFSIMRMNRDLETDSVHLNERGRRRVADAVYHYLSNSAGTALRLASSVHLKGTDDNIQ